MTNPYVLETLMRDRQAEVARELRRDGRLRPLRGEGKPAVEPVPTAVRPLRVRVGHLLVDLGTRLAA